MRIQNTAVFNTLLTATVYVITGQLGFYLAIYPGNVSAVWPPAGVALAAVLLRGIGAWSSIWLGAFVVNLLFYTRAAAFSDLAVVTSGVIAIGSTLQALTAGYLLRKRIKDREIVSQPHDTLVFTAISAACCFIGATIGVTSLCLAGFAQWSNYDYTWLTWWAGDTAGILVFTPLILSWRRLPSFVKNPRRLAEFVVLLVLLAAGCYLVFGDSYFGRSHFPIMYCIFPFLAWAAGRFGISGVSLTVAMVELFAIAGMKQGLGPFIFSNLNVSLLLLAAFMAALLFIGLTFASIINQWQCLRQRLENTAQDLESKVLERTMELQEANRSLLIARDRAVEASSIKSAFLANMSHEFRTPLSGILGMTELLLNCNLDQHARDMVETLDQSGNALLELTNDILDLSKIEAGKVTLQCEPFNPAFLIQDCTTLFAPAAIKKKLKLHSSLDTQLPQFLYGDASRVRQVLLNLIGNAIKFTNYGSVRASAALESEDNQVVTIQFIVEDTGLGIEKDKQQVLFKPFSQVDTTATRRFGGAGLGLAISKQLVEMMGGTMGMETEFHRGSKFWFTIPFYKRAPPDQSNEFGAIHKSTIEQLPPDITTNKNVLVVEDNEVLRKITDMQLTSLGLHCSMADTGAVAIEEFKTGKYDLIFMDIHLPDLSGYDVCARIRDLESDRNVMPGHGIPIIALTAGAMPGDREAALGAGLDDYLPKPVRIDELRFVLARWLTRQRTVHLKFP